MESITGIFPTPFYVNDIEIKDIELPEFKDTNVVQQEVPELKDKIFENIWVQPAAGDAGGSLGAALTFWHQELKNPRTVFKDQMKGSFLGPKFNDEFIERSMVGIQI